MNQKLRGLWPALLVPIDGSGAIDNARCIAHGKNMLAAGSDGITLFGTTGEGPAFSNAERKALLAAVLAAGIWPEQVIVTTSACALPDAIDLGRHAAALGCHQQMFMPPFYFRAPRDAGIVEAVSQVVRGIADQQLKLLLYHIPGLSSVSFSHDSITTLVRRHPGQVIGVKDSSGDLEHALGLTGAFPDLSILVGAEPHVAPTMCAGGSGSINGLANIAPRLMHRIVAAPAAVSPADELLMAGLLALLTVLPDLPFVDVYKTMLAEQTGDDTWLHVRAPLCPLDPHEELRVRQGYRALGVDAGQL